MPDQVGHDEKTMDKIIEKKTGWRVAFTKKALPWWLGALLLAFIVYLIARPNNKTLRVDKDTVTIASAVKWLRRCSGRCRTATVRRQLMSRRFGRLRCKRRLIS